MNVDGCGVGYSKLLDAAYPSQRFEGFLQASAPGSTTYAGFCFARPQEVDAGTSAPRAPSEHVEGRLEVKVSVWALDHVCLRGAEELARRPTATTALLRACPALLRMCPTPPRLPPACSSTWRGTVASPTTPLSPAWQWGRPRWPSARGRRCKGKEEGEGRKGQRGERGLHAPGAHSNQSLPTTTICQFFLAPSLATETKGVKVGLGFTATRYDIVSCGCLAVGGCYCSLSALAAAGAARCVHAAWSVLECAGPGSIASLAA